MILQMTHRPYDVRIWQAQGMCYEEMNRYVLRIFLAIRLPL